MNIEDPCFVEALQQISTDHKFKKYCGKLSYTHCKRRVTAGDITNETIKLILKGIQRGGEPRNLMHFAYVVARYYCLAVRAKIEREEKAIEKHTHEPPRDQLSQEERTIRNEQQQIFRVLLKRAYRNSPEVDKEIFELHLWWGAGSEQLAPLFGLTENQFKKKIKSVRDRLIRISTKEMKMKV